VVQTNGTFAARQSGPRWSRQIAEIADTCREGRKKPGKAELAGENHRGPAEEIGGGCIGGVVTGYASTGYFEAEEAIA
jgi:hypothetical protein